MAFAVWATIGTVFTVAALRDSPEFRKVVKPRTGVDKEQAYKCLEHLEYVKGHIRWLDHYAGIGKRPCQYRNQGIPKDLFTESIKLVGYAERTLRDLMRYHKKHFESRWGWLLNWIAGSGTREHRMEQYNNRLQESALWINIATLTMTLRANYDAASHNYKNILMESKQSAQLLRGALLEAEKYWKRYPERMRHISEIVQLTVIGLNAEIAEDDLYWIPFSQLTTPSGTTLGNTTSPSPPLLSRREMRQQKNEFVRIEKHSRGVRKTRYRTIVIEGDSDTSHYSGYSQAGHGQYYQTTTPNGWTGGAFMSGAIPPPWNSQQQQPPYIGPLPTPHVITVEHQPPHIVEIHPPPETREPVPSTQQRRKTSYKVITRDQPRSRSRSRSRSPSPRRAASRRAPSRRETSTSRRPDAARGRSPSQKPPPSRSDDRVSAASIRQASSSSRVPSQSRTHARPPPSNPSRSRPHSTTSNYRAQPPIPALPPGPPPISIHAITASSRQDRERELQYQSTSSRRPSSSSRPPSSYRAPSSSSRQPSSRASSTQRTEDSGYVSNSTSRASHRRAERERESAGEPAGARSSKYPPTSGRWVRAAAPKKEGGGTNSRSSRGSSRDSGVGSETGDRESERGDRGKKREVSIEFERRRPPSKGEGKRVVDDRRGRR